MFQIDLNLLCLLTDLPFDTPMMIKIRKDHWHYNLIEQVSSPLLHTRHSFQLMEQEEKEPWFQLQLVSQFAANKGKMLGEATIRIQEWPMETVKFERIRLSSFAWLEIELSYKYVSIASAYPNTIN